MRGDVVLVDFPFSDASASKRRPALVVQSDSVVSVDTIIVPITSNIARASATRLVVDPVDEGNSGLKMVSAIACEGLFSLHRSLIVRTIGSLSSAAMIEVDNRLKTALGLT